MEVTVHLLGGAGVAVDGSPATGFAGRSAAQLVALLALDPAHRLHRERVMAALWPDAAPDYRYTVEPDGGATRLTLVADLATRGPWRLLGPVIGTAIRRTDAGQLDTLAGMLGG